MIFNRNNTEKNKSATQYIGILILAAVFGLASCDAPRDNPLDPENPNAVLGVLEGQVKSQSVPRIVLADVVILKNGTVVGRSSASGTFRIENLRVDDGWVYFEKPGYKSDSVYVAWNGAKQNKLEIFLNANPKLDSIAVYSIVMSRFALPSLNTVFVRAVISDPDKDIDSVFLTSSELNVRQFIPYNQNTRAYERQFLPLELNVDNAEVITGLNLSIAVRDISGSTFIVGAGSVRRFITNPIGYISPANNDTVGVNPVLTWQDYSPGFTFSQHVQVYSNEAEFNPVLVWERVNMPIDSLGVFVDKTLPTGKYFWVIWAIDNFSDRIRSNPASFFVKGNSY